MKHYITIYGHHRVDIHGRHRFVHHLVYECWNGPIPPNMQINHYDDDKDNNNVENLYAGTQKDNIRDWIANNHRKGNLYTLVILEKKTGKILRFCPSSDFMKYAGHYQENKGVSRSLKRKWFSENFELICFERGVTTMADECKPVGRILSPSEAHRTSQF